MSLLLCIQCASPLTYPPNRLSTHRLSVRLFGILGALAAPLVHILLSDGCWEILCPEEFGLRSERKSGVDEGATPEGPCSTIPACFSATRAASPPSGKGGLSQGGRTGRGAQGSQPEGFSSILTPRPSSRLAATRGTRLVKREYLKVNVVKTW